MYMRSTLDVRRRSPPNAVLPGLLACVHIIDGFSRICRESGRSLMYNGTHIRIKAGDGVIW